jgi:3-hydroxybutyryl-CoA dehydrogenase
MTNHSFSTVGIVGAGAMGRGIAQIAAQAGSRVVLLDAQPGAAEAARSAIGAIGNNRGIEPSAQHGTPWSTRLQAVDGLAALAGCDLVVEAIVERLDAKQALFAELETCCRPRRCWPPTPPRCRSPPGRGLQHPGALPATTSSTPVPLMKVVEVMPACTDPAVCRGSALCAPDGPHAGAARTRRASSSTTPGAATAPRPCASSGRRGRLRHHRPHPARPGRLQARPFELMDLTGLDVSHPVMESIYHQYYEEARYRPSVITAQRLAGGMLAQDGEGFYRYRMAQQLPPEPPAPQVARCRRCGCRPAPRRAELYQLLKNLGATSRPAAPSPGPDLVAPLGFDVTTVAVVERLDPARTVGIDMLIDDAATRRVLATNPATRATCATRRTRCSHATARPSA